MAFTCSFTERASGHPSPRSGVPRLKSKDMNCAPKLPKQQSERMIKAIAQGSLPSTWHCCLKRNGECRQKLFFLTDQALILDSLAGLKGSPPAFQACQVHRRRF